VVEGRGKAHAQMTSSPDLCWASVDLHFVRAMMVCVACCPVEVYALLCVVGRALEMVVVVVLLLLESGSLLDALPVMVVEVEGVAAAVHAARLVVLRCVLLAVLLLLGVLWMRVPSLAEVEAAV